MKKSTSQNHQNAFLRPLFPSERKGEKVQKRIIKDKISSQKAKAY